MDLFDLAAKITLDSSGYEKGISEAVTKAGGFGGKLKTALSTAGKIGGVAVGAVTTATSALSAAFVKGTGDLASYGDNIDKMSQKMGLSATAYQEWDAVMQHSGTSIESLQYGMKTLANAVENGNDAFERLGITQKDIESMNNEELFSATITALQNVDNETERTYLAGQLLGRGATELGALLNTSAEETQEMKDRVHELGGVMSDDAVKAAAKYQDSLQDMQTAFAGLGRGMLGDMMPAITNVMDGLTEIFSGNGDAGIEMISSGIDQLLSNISEKLPEFIDVAFEILSSLVDTLIDNLPKLLEMGGKFVGKLIAGIIEKLPDLIKKAPEIILAIVDGLTASWPDIKNAGIDLIKMLMDGIAELFSKLKEKGTEIIGVVHDGIKQKIEDAKEWGSNIITGFWNGIKEKVDWLKSNVSIIADTIKEGFDGFISDALSWGKDLIDNFVGGIKANIGKVGESIKGVADKIKGLIGFSEPEDPESPLHNFHTFAPDMMALFAKGVKDNTHLITDQIDKSFDFGSRMIPATSGNRVGVTQVNNSVGNNSEQTMKVEFVLRMDDGTVLQTLSRKLYPFMQKESVIHGSSMVKGGAFV